MTPSLVASRVRIRAPRTADAEQLGFLNRQLGYATETEELVARIDRLSELDGHFVAVAEVDGKVVGWVQAEHRFSMEAGDKAELVGLIVGAAARRSGVGGLLVQAAEDWAADRGLRSIVVRSSEPNAFGVLDHWVSPPSGAQIYIPLRVVKNGSGC